jgi:hypothetical protein
MLANFRLWRSFDQGQRIDDRRDLGRLLSVDLGRGGECDVSCRRRQQVDQTA